MGDRLWGGEVGPGRMGSRPKVYRSQCGWERPVGTRGKSSPKAMGTPNVGKQSTEYLRERGKLWGSLSQVGLGLCKVYQSFPHFCTPQAPLHVCIRENRGGGD